MPKVTKLTVHNIRIHDSFNLEFANDTTVLIGANGAGKTSLIEALYLAMQGSSFKGSDQDMLKNNSPWWRIEVWFDDETHRTVTFDPNKATGKKQFTIDTKKNYRLLPRYRYPVVLFEPDDLQLLSGSPARRRRFIDHFIAQVDSRYRTVLTKYDRALKQRNTLLKKSTTTTDELFIWDMSLSEFGAYIVEQRVKFIEELNKNLSDRYSNIAGSNVPISVHYSHTLIDNMQQKLLSELHVAHKKDIFVGYTTIGPHRHDMVFRYGDSPALSVASRGEVRTILLALKLIEADIITTLSGLQPLVLLDDVFSELDENRQRDLIESLKNHQIIITSALPFSDSRNDYITLELSD